MPFYEDRDRFGRMLLAQMAWTKDMFQSKEMLIVGLNTLSGIYIDKTSSERPWHILGISLLWRLS